MTTAGYLTFLKPFLVQWEGFSAVPYWDVSRWSWGYGTRVPGSSDNKAIKPTGTITRAKAMVDALVHVRADHEYLASLITSGLNSKQWAALLSFSYNLGTGNSDNLVTNINSGDTTALETQWKKYVYAGGVMDPDLVARRNAEWELFTS
jgi:lysozyme